MKLLRNLLLGLGISFLGSIPLGYLNVIGFQIYEQSGISALTAYLFGIISVEVVILYFTYKGALFLSKQAQMARLIDLFSIVFLLILAFIFWMSENRQNNAQAWLSEGSFFLKGISLNMVNLMQVPFWLGWHFYVNQNDQPNLLGRNLYFLGALLGTFLGMLSFVLLLAHFSHQSTSLQKYLLSCLVPLFFVLLAFYQIFRYRKKHFAN